MITPLPRISFPWTYLANLYMSFKLRFSKISSRKLSKTLSLGFVPLCELLKTLHKHLYGYITLLCNDPFTCLFALQMVKMSQQQGFLFQQFKKFPSISHCTWHQVDNSLRVYCNMNKPMKE